MKPCVRTLDSDVSDAAAIVTHLHVETTQHGEQLEAEHAAIFGSFRHCRDTSQRCFLSDTEHETGTTPVSRQYGLTCPALSGLLHLFFVVPVAGGGELRRHGAVQVVDG